MRDTSEFVAEELIQRVRLGSEDLRLSILEPSAGIGFLADKISENFKGAIIDCIELNEEKYNVLKNNFPNAIHGDFLKVDIQKKYDLIIAAPPFKGNIDLAHIMKMYELLQPTGRMVSLTSPYWLTNNEPLQLEFRNWLKDKWHKIKMLPDMSFSERNKTVPTAIIELWKL
jgi:16S rRNA G1207 methylase RsmC